jgi:glycosyltransferase involved in cell wall biosynthesis
MSEANPVIAYLMSRFPTVSETFVLYEMLELERNGLRVEVFPLIFERTSIVHPGAEPLIRRAQRARPRFVEAIRAQFYWLRRRPRAYLRAWCKALAGNRSSPRFLARSLVVVPLAAAFARRMEALGVDHIHAHWATHPTLAAYVVQELTGLPYSFTAHAHDIYVERPMLEEKIRAARFVATISEYNRRLLGRLYGSMAADKTALIRCGVDLDAFSARPPRAHVPGAPLTILCVASLRDYKGQSYLIDACGRLSRAGLSLRCLLVGDGEDRRRLENRIARSGLQDVVVLLGHQPRDRVSALMQEADVLVLPSVTTPSGKMEGIPVALMEAMAVGLPVISTAISGIPELVLDGETGLLVPERDPKALATAVLRLSREPQLGSRLAVAGRAKVMREYDLHKNAARLLKLLAGDPGHAAAL